jgi:hypothetical protein
MPTVTVNLDDETYRWFRELNNGEKSRTVREAIEQYREDGEVSDDE